MARYPFWFFLFAICIIVIFRRRSSSSHFLEARFLCNGVLLAEAVGRTLSLPHAGWTGFHQLSGGQKWRYWISILYTELLSHKRKTG